MTTRREENAMALASLVGVDAEEAARLLDCTIAVVWDPADKSADAIAAHLLALLSRTVTAVSANATSPQAMTEVAIGNVVAQRPGSLRLSVGTDAIRIGGGAQVAPIAKAPKVLELITACYAAGMAIKAALGATARLPGPSPETGLVVPTKSLLGEDARWTSARVSGRMLARRCVQ